MKYSKYFLTLSLIIFTNTALIGQFLFLNGTKIHLEIAETTVQKAYGLMYRKTLDIDKGMLFKYSTDRFINMWMKNTYIPLDMVWINASQNVVYIHKDAKPKTLKVIRPNKKATMVLEVNAGVVDKTNLKVGQRITFQE